MSNILIISLQATILIIFTMIFRLLFKKTYKIFTYIMWIIVLLRLCIPLQIESPYGVFSFSRYNIGDSDNNKNHYVEQPQKDWSEDPNIGNIKRPEVNYENTILEEPQTQIQNGTIESTQPHTDVRETPTEIFITKEQIVFLIWILGILVISIMSVVQYVTVRRQVRFAINIKDNIWETDGIGSAFVMGVFKTRIYMPVHINEQQREYILLHEQMHIKHKDYIVRIIMLMVNTIYWWNPFVWIAVYLMKKDMEMLCDESVTKQMRPDRKKYYLQTLLQCSGKNSGIIPVMSFSESNIEGRIKHIMNVKKPKFYVAIVLILFTIVCYTGCVVKKANYISNSEVNYKEETTKENVTESNEPKSQYDMSVENSMEYEQTKDGKWKVKGGYKYDHRSIVSGILPGDTVRTTFVVLCKNGYGFELAANKANQSRNQLTHDSFAQIVEHIRHDYKLEDGRYISEVANSQEFIELDEDNLTIRDLTLSFYGDEYEYYILGDVISIENEERKASVKIIDDVTLEYNNVRYVHIDASEKEEVIFANKTGYPQYDELLEKIIEVNKTNPTFEGYKSIGVCYTYGYKDGFKRGGFYLIDLDEDGTEEMLLGENGPGAWVGTIYDIYTIEDGKLKQVCSGGERDIYNLCEGKVIKNSGNGGASHGTEGFYVFENGNLVLKQGLVFNGDYNPDNPWHICGNDFKAENGTPISTDKAWDIINEYEKILIEFNSFEVVGYK